MGSANLRSGKFNQFLKIGLKENFILKSGRLPATLHHAGGRIYVDTLPYNLAQKNCCYRSERSIHQSVRYGGKQNSLIGLRVLCGWVGGRGGGGWFEFRRPQEGREGHLAADKLRQVERLREILRFYGGGGGGIKCKNPNQ